jgi:protein SCO1/2
VGIEPKLGARVPVNLPFKNESWKLVSLGQCMAGKPTVLVLAYYRCPMLCTEVLNGLLRSLKAVPDDVGNTFNAVVVSFDPREKPPLAGLKKAAYTEQYDRPGTEQGWHFLTGESLAIEALTGAVGFGYQYDPDTQQYAHGSGLFVLAPDGTIARYLPGIRFEPRDLRLALAEASEGKVSSTTDRVLLLCYRYDPVSGKYTPAVLNIVRLASALSIAFIAALVGLLSWRGRRDGSMKSPAPLTQEPRAC